VSWQWRSIVVVWVLAAACAILIGLLVDSHAYLTWIGLALGGCVIATLCVQIATGHKDGYVVRVTKSISGAVVILAGAAGILLLVS
jgi:hypothetical protein